MLGMFSYVVFFSFSNLERRVRRRLHGCTCLSGQLSGSENSDCKQTSSSWRTRSKHVSQSQYHTVNDFRHDDTNLANPRTSAWFMKSLRWLILGHQPGLWNR
eukprot:1158358-Pelagomonas_calceolata.AAC.1